MSAGRVVVAALGCEFRGDDGAGPAVLTRVRSRANGSETIVQLASPFQLLGVWDEAELALVVDAVAPGDEPGSVVVVELQVDASSETCGLAAPRPSSHGLGVVEVLRVAAALDVAPRRVMLVGVTGERFGPGIGLSPSTSRRSIGPRCS